MRTCHNLLLDVVIVFLLCSPANYKRMAGSQDGFRRTARLGRSDTRVDIGSQERRRNGKIVQIYLAEFSVDPNVTPL